LTSAQLDLQLRFVSCMRRHGVPDMPDPLSGGGFSPSALNAAAGIPSSQQGPGPGPGHSNFASAKSPQFKRALNACHTVAAAAGFVHTPEQIEQHDAQLLKIFGVYAPSRNREFPGSQQAGRLHDLRFVAIQYTRLRGSRKGVERTT
jgi:hypothetical protein